MFLIYTILFLTQHGVIICIARKQDRRIATETACEEAASIGEAKARKTMTLILGIFYLCWGPFVIVCLVVYGIGYGPNWLLALVNVTIILGISNSIMNPIVYACRDHKFRKAFKSLLRINQNCCSREWFIFHRHWGLWMQLHIFFCNILVRVLCLYEALFSGPSFPNWALSLHHLDTQYFVYALISTAVKDMDE